MQKKKSERATGDLITYFAFHNLISVLLVFILTVSFKIYISKIEDVTIWFIFGRKFWELVFLRIFPIIIISSVFGRITAYLLINAIYSYQKKSTKRWTELNRGLNKMGFAFIITALITAFFYSIGIITVLQDKIFNEKTLLTLIGTYVILKLGVYFGVRWLVGSKT